MPETEVEKEGIRIANSARQCITRMAAAVAKKEEGTLESDKNQAMRMFIRLRSAGLTGFQVCGWLSSLRFVCLDLEAQARACINHLIPPLHNGFKLMCNVQK